MRMARISATALSLGLGMLLAAGQADAQGKGKEKAKTGEHYDHPSQARGTDKAYDKGNKGRPAPAAVAQERSNRDKGKAADKARPDRGDRGKVVSEAAGSLSRADDSRGRGRFIRGVTLGELRPKTRAFASSKKHAERVAGRAVAVATLRGLSDDALLIVPVGTRVHVKNRKGLLLLDLDEDRSRNLGSWRVVSLDGREGDGSPSFCRSGAGHPVWGRQWCLDKGFGLGVDRGVHWGRTLDLGDVILRPRTDSNDLTRDVLAAVLGDIVFNRIAAHAITLGYTDPITGRWIGESTGPRVLLLNAGDRTVAEIVDNDRDDRADVLLVALRPW